MKQEHSVYIEKFKLSGEWHEITLDDLKNGMISNLNLSFLQKKPFTSYYYGITVFVNHNLIKYFIGTATNNGNLDLSNLKYYKISDINTSYIQPIYFELGQKHLDLLLLFDGDINSNPIPVRIERYQVRNTEVILDEILIPIK